MDEKALFRRAGKLIRRQRKAKDMTIEDLAYEAQVDYKTISEIERGLRKSPTFSVVYSLVVALDFTDTFLTLLNSKQE